MWSELHFALERRKSTMLLFTTKLYFVGKQICTMGKKPNYILLMKLSDWKVQAVLNLSIFPCRGKKKEKQSWNWVFTNTKTELQRRKGHSRTTELWLHLNSATPALHFRLYFLALLSHSKNGTQQSRRVLVPACLCQTNKIISCIRKYDKYNLRMLDQSEAKPWVSDAAVNEWKIVPSHSVFRTWRHEAVRRRQEVVQPLPRHKYMQQKGGGREVTAPQGFPINPPLLNILHNDTMRYMIIRSDIIIK